MFRTTYVEREHRATGYTIGALTVEAEDHPALEAVGYGGTTTIYAVFTDGQVLGADHDPHRLTRQLDKRWLLDPLQELADGAASRGTRAVGGQEACDE